MLNDYVYGPMAYPHIHFDSRFAKRYGIVEAIIFDQLYYDFLTELQMKLSSGWPRDEGWIEEAGRWWRRYTSRYLFGSFSVLFDAQEHKRAVGHLCQEGLLFLKPSVTDGYWWIAIGEESEHATDKS